MTEITYGPELVTPPPDGKYRCAFCDRTNKDISGDKSLVWREGTDAAICQDCILSCVDTLFENGLNFTFKFANVVVSPAKLVKQLNEALGPPKESRPGDGEGGG